LPVGTYELAVTAAGFKKYLRPGIGVNVAATVRVDAALEVGAATESITIQAEAPLLKTESGELSHTVDYNRVDNIPLLTLGTPGTLGNVRNPLQVVTLLPGAVFASENTLRINGMPSSSQAIRIEGQDATNGFWREINQNVQGSVDAIQEVAIQTSNYSPEYGQAGGGYFNYTMRSGTNQFHGSAYDYFDNEALNAGLPFTDNGAGGHIRNTVRRNDYGFTLVVRSGFPRFTMAATAHFSTSASSSFAKASRFAMGLQRFPRRPIAVETSARPNWLRWA
jgi:hypothetical protein